MIAPIRSAAVLCSLVLLVGACGDDDDEATTPTGPPTIGVEEVDQHDGEVVVVEGLLLAAPEAVHRLCTALAESYPPRCGGARVEIVGLDLFSLTGTSTNDSAPEGERTVWTDRAIRLTGSVDSDRLALVSGADGLGDGLVVVEAVSDFGPVTGAAVELWSSDDAVASATTDAVGIAVFRATPGNHAVVALPVGGLTPPPAVAVAVGESVLLEYGSG